MFSFYMQKYSKEYMWNYPIVKAKYCRYFKVLCEAVFKTFGIEEFCRIRNCLLVKQSNDNVLNLRMPKQKGSN